MRIRTIKPEFFVHEDLYELEKSTGLPLRLAYIGLWSAADREGRFKWTPRSLGVQILPYDNVDFSRVLDALATRGFIVQYTSETPEDGSKFGFIPKFLKHQNINNRETPSILPSPATGLVLDAWATREPRDDDAPSGEGKGREGKGRERKEKDASPSEPKFIPEIPSEFSEKKRAALAEWLDHKRGRKENYKPKGWEKFLARLEKFSEYQICTAIDDAIERNWAGIFPEKVTGTGPVLFQGNPDFGQKKKSAPESEPEGWQDICREMYPGASVPDKFDSLALEVKRSIRTAARNRKEGAA